MTRSPDRRLHAYRPDLADETLRGKVDARRFVPGRPGALTAAITDLRPSPDAGKGIDTQALRGEALRIFENANGWCWVQMAADGYVGYVPSHAVSENAAPPTHVVTALRTFVYPLPDLKEPALEALSLGSRLAVSGEEETRGTPYAMLDDGTAVIARHLRSLDDLPIDEDYVTVAARFLETPYLWGGRSAFGIDCSGLVQLAMAMTGKAAPRDSDMQAAGLGHEIAESDLARGDLVFWKGHVAIMEDPQTTIHANGSTMTVARESLADAVERIAPLFGSPTCYRRP